MTATRIVRPATLAVAAGIVWILAASLLWRTKVPSGLQLPSLDSRSVFGPHVVSAGTSFDRFFELEWLIATIASLAALVVMTRRGPRFVRSLGLGPVNAGVITGVLVATVLWAVNVPFGIAASWWSRRHGISQESWGSIVFSPWGGLLRTTLMTVIVLAVVLTLAKRFAQSWWIPAAAIVLGLAVLLQLLTPYLQRLGAHRVRSPAFAGEIRRLEDREHVGRPSVRLVPMRHQTTAANAFAIGIGPS